MIIWIILIMALIMLKTTLSITCTDPNMLNYALHNIEYQSTNFIDGTYGRVVRIGPISGQVYTFGKADSINNYTLITKWTTDGTETYTRAYLLDSIEDSFILDSSETYMYFIEYDSTYLRIFQMLASDGTMNNIKKISPTPIGPITYHRFYLLDTANTLFFGIDVDGLGEDGMCRWVVGSSSME
jgi:hypothetical protein